MDPLKTCKPVSETLDDERPRPDSPDVATFQHHLARYHFARNWIRPEFDVFETGCGTGYGAHLLSSLCRSILATDYSPLAIEYACRRYQAANLRFAVMDCRDLKLDAEQFDCVISFEVFEHLEDQPAYLRACRRILRPGGLLILSTPNHETTAIHMKSIQQHNPFHVGEVGLREFRRLLEPVFPQHTIYGQRRRGNALYDTLRALDAWNLRLRLFSNRRREALQSRFGVSPGSNSQPEDYVFKTSQLRQCNHFVAVCRRKKK